MKARPPEPLAPGPFAEAQERPPVDAHQLRSPLLRRLVDALLARRAAQRPALVRETNLPLQTVADLLAGLASRGLVVVNGRFSGMPGRSTLSYSLAGSAAVGLFVRVAAAHVEAGLCDLHGALIANECTPRTSEGASGLVEHIDKAARLICHHADIEHFRLAAAYVVLEGDDPDMAGVVEPLALCLGCPVDLDFEVGVGVAERLDRMHKRLLAALFGEAP
jgi:hypothetical protein